MSAREMIARDLIAVPPYAWEVELGLAARPKSLPSKLFYDQRGSALFEEITQLPEYYLTRAELEILHERSAEIGAAAGHGLTVVELGAGTAAKTATLLRALAARQLRVEYFPVDISWSALVEARRRVEAECPRTRVRPAVADFSEGFGFLRGISGPRLVLYLGSSIGNFDPDDAIEMLRKVRTELNAGDALLLGTDLVKDQAVMLAAYDDAQGVTAEFNKNILRRMNLELDGDFDLDSFDHVALWNSDSSRMEMHLESVKPQAVHLRLLALNTRFGRGERMHTENSYKYTMPMVREMLQRSGFDLEQSWMDQREWFALHLARVH